MKRGSIERHESEDNLQFKRNIFGSKEILTLKKSKCIGCNICKQICPMEAINKSKSIVKNGRLTSKSIIDIDPDKCIFCGGCVILCPTNAIKMTKNQKEIIPLVEFNVFPLILNETNVKLEKCDISCNLICSKDCPMEAIEIKLKEEGNKTRIIDLKIDKEKCVFCGKCQLVCPKEAIHVNKTFEGKVVVNIEFCPINCKVCMDICPSKAISLDNKSKPIITEETCIYCGACQEVCPEKTIEVKRTKILHQDIKSAAWLLALEKLTSKNVVLKKLNANLYSKLKEKIENTKN
jgi:4Fe-4S ferredoxin